MADQIQQPWPATGATLYAIIRDSQAQAADVVNSEMEAYATANLDDYDTALTEQGTASCHYVAAFPSWLSAGRYLISVHEQAGGSPAETDSTLASEWYDWDGTSLAKVATVGADGDTLETISDQLDNVASSGVMGSGADHVTITVNMDGSPIADADVWITSDAAGSTVVAGTLHTDNSGQVTFLLDAGSTYYMWAQKNGMNSILGRAFTATAD